MAENDKGSEKKERKQRVALKATPEQFIKQWFEFDGSKSALAKAYGGVSIQTVSKYAAGLRKAGVELPHAKRDAGVPRTKTPVDVAGLNDLIKSLSKK